MENWAEHLECTLIDEESLQKRIHELGEEITRDYEGKDLVLIGILKGSIMFLSDLCKEIPLSLAMDFMSVSSYGNRSESSGVVRILKDLDQNIENKDVLIVEDIIDSGLTLSYLRDNLSHRGPRSIQICTLLDKPDRRVAKDIHVNYCGFIIPDKFVVGYGLDFSEKYRNIPFIGALKRELYE
ncbi:hypoxanthine phosphoribosyltransferase [Peptostreptococcaceae bacterium oral taxon 113 str. W5053]|nr:hypoxanthine phosphoribosyltransferase [Peptostreptococcaceae bacterium oral taxon 113 str. W5053]